MIRPILVFILALLPFAASDAAERSTLYELVRNEQWPDVVELLNERLEANPYYGEDWYLLGLAHARLGDCASAAPLYGRALELGNNASTWGMRDARIEAAQCAAVLDDVNLIDYAHGGFDRSAANFAETLGRVGIPD